MLLKELLKDHFQSILVVFTVASVQPALSSVAFLCGAVRRSVLNCIQASSAFSAGTLPTTLNRLLTLVVNRLAVSDDWRRDTT